MNLRTLFRRLVVGGYKPIRRPKFAVDRALVSKQLRAAESCPVNGIKGRLEQQPDSFNVHAHTGEDHYPIG